jgi:hypothetical protein
MHSARPFSSRSSMFVSLISIALLLGTVACRSDSDSQGVRPRQLRDVPARRLAFSFQADVDPPPGLLTEESKIVPAIQDDFDQRHPDYALSRTVVSPDSQRALALYNTTDEPSQSFRIALYSADGTFLRDVTPPELAVVFQDSVAWSADSNFIAFVGRRSLQVAAPSPTPIELVTPALPSASPVPTASVAPAFLPLAVFGTEQVYLCNRDGYDLRPLTTRDGLIYFALSWAPDTHALAALACKESEWESREKAFKTPAGRPRLISLDGTERLLDDALAEAPPVWSPDSSKVATAFGVDIGVYDSASKSPTQARIELRERLLAASAAFDEKLAGKKKPEEPSNKTGKAQPNSSPTGPQPNGLPAGPPVSFNPIVRLEWPTPDKLYFETAYISLRSELIKTFSRWHMLTLSPQAAVLGR